jgi:hypothetical protein
MEKHSRRLLRTRHVKQTLEVYPQAALDRNKGASQGNALAIATALGGERGKSACPAKQSWRAHFNRIAA